MRGDEQSKGRRGSDTTGRKNRWRERVKKHEGRGETERERKCQKVKGRSRHDFKVTGKVKNVSIYIYILLCLKAGWTKALI